MQVSQAAAWASYMEGSKLSVCCYFLLLHCSKFSCDGGLLWWWFLDEFCSRLSGEFTGGCGVAADGLDRLDGGQKEGLLDGVSQL